VVTGGRAYEVDRPEVIPIAEATPHFQAREQRLHRQFGVTDCLRVRRLDEGAGAPTSEEALKGAV